MDNMSNAAINKKAVLEQLVATNAKQAFAIAIQVTTILVLYYKVKQPQLRIINIWIIGGR